MTSAENAEDGLDLYDDILVEDLTCQQDSLHEIEKKYKEALRTIAVLEDIKSQNEANITNLQKKNAYLMKNISVLYKTACVELERKKVIIESLQNERNHETVLRTTHPHYLDRPQNFSLGTQPKTPRPSDPGFDFDKKTLGSNMAMATHQGFNIRHLNTHGLNVTHTYLHTHMDTA